MSLLLLFNENIIGVNLSVTEADDSLSASATVLVQPSLSVTEADDSLSASATVNSLVAITANLSIIEDDDSLSSTLSHRPTDFTWGTARIRFDDSVRYANNY